MGEEQKNIEMLKIAFDAVRYGTGFLGTVHIASQGYAWSIPEEFRRKDKKEEKTMGKQTEIINLHNLLGGKSDD